MAGGKLEVQIGADKTDFDKKIKEVEYDIKELSKVKLDRLKLGLDTTEINAQIKDAKNNLNALKSTLKDTGQSFTALKPQVANGGNALMQFGRIVQDAPFGIVGIGNNITATAEAFSALKNQTGSTGGALKALASSIAGTGGILLGVSLLTTGLTYLAQSGLSVQDVIDKLTGNFDEFGATLRKVNEDSAKTSGQEIANLKALVSVAQNETLSREKRLIAVKKLQDEFPAYFGNLNTEKILNGDITKTVNQLTTAIIARAKASAFSAEIGKLAMEELSLMEKLKKANDELNKGVQGSVRGASRSSASVQYASMLNTVKDLEKSILENKRKQRLFTDEINKSTAAYIDLEKTATKGAKAKEPKKVKSKFEFDTKFIAPFVGTISGLADNMDGFAERAAKAFQNATGNVKAETDKMQAILDEFNLAVNDLIQNSISSTFSDLGTAIGTAIASGGDVLSAIGQSLIQGLSNFLSQLGDKLITYGLLLAAFGKAELAFAVGDPVTKIGAGLAMVALGVAAKAASAAVSSFGGGGFNGRGASSSTGSNANNSSFTSGGFSSPNNGGTVVFEISGQKLIGVLSNTLNANKRLGGALGLG